MRYPVKKILSAMFVGCMLMSAGVINASAVDVAPEIDLASAPVMAGASFKNCKAIAYIEQEDGSIIAKEFDYIAPRSASNRALSETAIRAAYGQLVNPMAARKMQYQQLSNRNNADIYPSNEGPEVTISADSELEFTPDFIAVGIANPSDSLKAVNVAMMNGKHKDEPYQLNFDVTQYVVSVQFKRNKSYKGGTAYMEKGDWISARVTSFNGGQSGTADIGLSAVIE
ncbi:MAG: hypothetical protein ACLUDG_01050 [Butyricicoccus sp.]